MDILKREIEEVKKTKAERKAQQEQKEKMEQYIKDEVAANSEKIRKELGL